MYDELNEILVALTDIQDKLTQLVASLPDQQPEPGDEPVEYTLEDCVEAAKDFLAAGDPGPVKAALAKVGADRVSNLAGDQITKFMEAM